MTAVAAETFNSSRTYLLEMLSEASARDRTSVVTAKNVENRDVRLGA